MDTPIIALTGGIASGKSTAAQFFLKKGVPLIDADQLVKEIYNSSEAIEFISNINQSFVTDNKIDFFSLRKAFFNNSQIKKDIEGFVYKKLPLEFDKKLSALSFEEYQFIIYDIPLLFERNMQHLFDQTLLIYTTAQKQIERIVKRDGNSEELAKTILNNQMPIDDKKLLANYVIENTESPKKLEDDLTQFLLSIID